MNFPPFSLPYGRLIPAPPSLFSSHPKGSKSPPKQQLLHSRHFPLIPKYFSPTWTLLEANPLLLLPGNLQIPKDRHKRFLMVLARPPPGISWDQVLGLFFQGKALPGQSQTCLGSGRHREENIPADSFNLGQPGWEEEQGSSAFKSGDPGQENWRKIRKMWC